jgi:hypothetical protein
LFGFSDGFGGAGSALNGCFVPIVGSNLTNHGFVSNDFSRTNGLTGNGTSKWIDLNRANDADAPNSRHLFVTYNVNTNGGKTMIGSGGLTGQSFLKDSVTANVQLDSLTSISRGAILARGSSIGANRNSFSAVRAYNGNGGGSTSNFTNSSIVPLSSPITLFASGGSSNYFEGSLLFYSIGGSFSNVAPEMVTLAQIVNTAFTNIT